ncbi:MAG: hypothetical protein OEL87_03635 [Nanoarchaeota archaeon]|nr:hypothetical protein [Nanoarchaeota archaeon]
MESDLIGKWSFLVGIVIAVLAAFITAIDTSTVVFILFILGLIVGYLNIDKKNTTEFLVSVIALLAVGSLGALSIGQLVATVGYLQTILNNFTVFVAAAALVVSIRAIMVTSKK